MIPHECSYVNLRKVPSATRLPLDFHGATYTNSFAVVSREMLSRSVAARVRSLAERWRRYCASGGFRFLASNAWLVASVTAARFISLHSRYRPKPLRA